MSRIQIFYSNLSKYQRIVLWFFVQLIIIIIIFAVVKIFMKKHEHVFVESDDSYSLIPVDMRDDFRNALWGVIQNNINNIEYDIVNDVVIREGTYEETDNDSGGKAINFIVDIDSLKQTYTAFIGWSEEGSDPYTGIVINCPPQNLMKYPDTVCYGMSNNTYSLDLYLPYIVYPEAKDDNENNTLAPNYMITGNEYDKTIDVMVSVCDAEGFKKKAMDYLDSTPVKLDEYKINYEVNNIDVDCQYGSKF